MAAVSEGYSILQEVHDQIVAMDLAGVPGTNVLIQKSLSTLARDLQKFPYPSILIAFGGPPVVKPVTNLRHDITRTVAIVCVDKDEPGNLQPGERQSNSFDPRLTWCETLIDSFTNDRLAASLGHDVQAKYLQIVDGGAYRLGYWLSGIQLAITTRRARR